MEDDGGRRRRRYEFDEQTNSPSSGLTLGGLLLVKQTPPCRIQDRTLLDLIRDDQTCGNEPKTTWKMFREKLRLKLVGSVCTTTVPTLASHIPISTDGNRTASRHGPTQQNATTELTWRSSSPLVTSTSTVPDMQTATVQAEAPVAEREQTSMSEDRGTGREEPAAVRMSLMSLLEVDGSTYLDAEVAEEETVEGGGGEHYKYNYCCVCMVRHKGAAFIPCGHTFCRLCSRELFVQRASCPLCNNFISEILDIF